jgi:hypothetical protein
MIETMLPLIVILSGFYVWHDALKARELARAVSQQLCAQAGVQLLDQTIALQRLGVARGHDGRLHLRRRYRFDISTDGTDRHQGTLEMLDGELLSHTLPIATTSTDRGASNVIELRAHTPIAPPRH